LGFGDPLATETRSLDLIKIMQCEVHTILFFLYWAECFDYFTFTLKLPPGHETYNIIMFTLLAKDFSNVLAIFTPFYGLIKQGKRYTLLMKEGRISYTHTYTHMHLG
jgi:hypothetical protein